MVCYNFPMNHNRLILTCQHSKACTDRAEAKRHNCPVSPPSPAPQGPTSVIPVPELLGTTQQDPGVGPFCVAVTEPSPQKGAHGGPWGVPQLQGGRQACSAPCSAQLLSASTPPSLQGRDALVSGQKERTLGDGVLKTTVMA